MKSPLLKKSKFKIGDKVRYKDVNPIYRDKTDDRVFTVSDIFIDCGFRYNFELNGHFFEHGAFEKELEKVKD